MQVIKKYSEFYSIRKDLKQKYFVESLNDYAEDGLIRYISIKNGGRHLLKMYHKKDCALHLKPRKCYESSSPRE